jgi:serine/threonine-protein kinase
MPDAALAPTQAIPFAIGSVIADRFELQALLGEGGMGAVFRAHDRELDDHVALKLLHLATAEDAATLRRFRREVKLARRVTHRNVARTFDLGCYEGLRFLTMELIEGESLARRVAREPLHLPESLRVAAEIARGLSAAHVVGVVHRDLKPENVMLGEARVVLTDFGIARVADGSADVMRTGMVVGTPAYMAPEQLENGAIDGRTDVYALGTMLFQLLARRLPFEGDSPFSLAAQRLTGDAPDLRKLDTSMPEAVAGLVREMLSRRREDRPDAQAVLDRIEALRGNAARVGRSTSRFTLMTSDSVVALGQPRTVAVEPLIGGTEGLAPLLTSAIVDGLTEARLAQLVSDSAAADLVVQGTLHASGEHVRVRLRVLGRKGAPVWAGHVDGSTTRSLDLEDGVVTAVAEAVRARTSRDPGPADPTLREAYDRAKVELTRFSLPNTRAALAILEDIESRKPGDARVRTLLARAVLIAWGQMGARDRTALARAEELALRALQDEPALAGAHGVIGRVRLEDGELAASLRATEECLRHDPRNASVHEAIGYLMCEALYVNEGRRRIELAARLEPNNPMVMMSLIPVVGLVGDRDRARALLAEMAARCGELSTIVVMVRLSTWWDDHEMAGRAADLIDASISGAAWEPTARLLRSTVRGVLEPTAGAIFDALTSNDVAPRQRGMMHEIAADYYARMGEGELALSHVLSASHLPFTNLLWLDHSPPLDRVRADPRFAEARATTAARCADLWGAVGPWPDG